MKATLSQRMEVIRACLRGGQSDLPKMERWLLAHLVDRINKDRPDDDAFLHQATLALELGASTKAVKAAVAALKKREFIDVRRPNRFSGNTYIIRFDSLTPWAKQVLADVEADEKRRRQMRFGGGREVPSGGGREVPSGGGAHEPSQGTVAPPRTESTGALHLKKISQKEVFQDEVPPTEESGGGGGLTEKDIEDLRKLGFEDPEKELAAFPDADVVDLLDRLYEDEWHVKEHNDNWQRAAAAVNVRNPAGVFKDRLKKRLKNPETSPTATRERRTYWTPRPPDFVVGDERTEATG